MDRAESDLMKLTAQEKVFAKALSNDPNAAKKKQIDDLEKDLAGLDRNLQALSVGLIPADKLPLALHDVLQSVGNLKLVGMETIEPSRLQLEHAEVAVEKNLDSDEGKGEKDDNKGDEDNVDDESIGVFKHAVVVELEGRYFDVIHYLAALEKLQWKFYWQAIDYEVFQYPKAKVLIEVYTLSTEQGVLGV